MKRANVVKRGSLIDPLLSPHHPTRGENNICARGLAATTYPRNSFPMLLSNCNVKVLSHPPDNPYSSLPYYTYVTKIRPYSGEYNTESKGHEEHSKVDRVDASPSFVPLFNGF